MGNSDILLKKLAEKNGGEFNELYQMNLEAIKISKRYDRWFWVIMPCCLLPILFGFVGGLITVILMVGYSIIHAEMYERELNKIYKN